MPEKKLVVVKLNQEIYQQIMQTYSILKTRSPNISLDEVIEKYIQLGMSVAEGDEISRFLK